jgi:hypothetical protein
MSKKERTGEAVTPVTSALGRLRQENREARR